MHSKPKFYLYIPLSVVLYTQGTCLNIKHLRLVVISNLLSFSQVRRVSASGIRIFSPNIPGVGTLRLRYPVMPFHEEGNNIYKNLIALQDITMDMPAYTRMFEKSPAFSGAVGC